LNRRPLENHRLAETVSLEALALRLAQAHGHRAEAYELAVKAEDLADWHDVPFDERLRFVRLFCAECNRIWDGVP
jgi:hypothetical protein